METTQEFANASQDNVVFIELEQYQEPGIKSESHDSMALPPPVHAAEMASYHIQNMTSSQQDFNDIVPAEIEQCSEPETRDATQVDNMTLPPPVDGGSVNGDQTTPTIHAQAVTSLQLGVENIYRGHETSMEMTQIQKVYACQVNVVTAQPKLVSQSTKRDAIGKQSTAR